MGGYVMREVGGGMVVMGDMWWGRWVGGGVVGVSWCVHLFLYCMCQAHGECVCVCMYVYKATTVTVGYAIYNVLYVVSFPDSGGDWGLGMRLRLRYWLSCGVASLSLSLFLCVRFGMLYVESKKGFVVQATCQRICILLSTCMFTNLDFALSHTHTHSSNLKRISYHWTSTGLHHC